MPKSSSMGPIDKLNPAPPLTQQGMRPNIARDRIELINMFNQYRMQREDPQRKVESSKQNAQKSVTPHLSIKEKLSYYNSQNDTKN